MDVTLSMWMKEQVVDGDMDWKEPFAQQIVFVRDHLTPLVGTGLPFEQIGAVANVVSTHESKSIKLPVYDLRRADMGLRLVLRGNFHDWSLSVLSETPITADFSGLFHTRPYVTGHQELSKHYFEGFPEKLIFGYYEPGDKRRWSAKLREEYQVYTTAFLIMRALGAPRAQSTRIV